MSLFMLGKTHVPHRKNTAKMAAVRIPAPQVVKIPMAQHIGAPATPVVKAGDTVYVGTLIGAAEAFVCAPVHSSVSGTVKKIEGYLTSSGKEGVVGWGLQIWMEAARRESLDGGGEEGGRR